MTLTLRGEEEAIAWGQRRAAQLRQGDAVLLFGPLGAGKTTLVKGIARGLGYTGHVLSPTFTILEVYDARLPIYHFDFYRIGGPEDLRAVDPREYYDQGITLIEWPERIEPWWPESRTELTLAIDGPTRTLAEREVRSALR
jgi:tRNA threonylcarbamoyladenosine biosynthesis protein TsaE